MMRELADLERRQTWSLVPYSDIPSNTSVAPGNWVYVEKSRPDDPNADSDGILRTSRRVVCGNRLPKSPRSETYTPVVSITTTRVLFSLAAYYDWHIRQADAVLAFLHGKLPHDIYMRQPTGFEEGPRNTLVCRVNGSLYGLDPSAKIWYDTVSLLNDLGFCPSPFDSALYKYSRSDRAHLFITLYVDDFSIFSSQKKHADWLVSTMTSRLELKDLNEPSKYLGLSVERHDQYITISQSNYIMSIASDFALEHSSCLYSASVYFRL